MNGFSGLENAHYVIWSCGDPSPVFSVERLGVVTGEQFTDREKMGK